MMFDTPTGTLARWVVDVYVLGSLLLMLWAASLLRLRQPARRLAAARASSAGLIVLFVLSAMPGWPRLSWREARPVMPRTLPSVGSARPEPFGPRPEVVAPSSGLTAIRPSPATQGRPEPDRIAETSGPAAATPASAWFDGPSIVEGSIRLYLAGSMVAVAWLGLGAIQAGRLLRGSRPAPDAIGRCLGRPIPRLRLSASIGQPMAVGLLRPAIVLPADFASRESEEALAAALRHEEAHVRNGDLAHLTVLRLLLPVLYLHPLYWWLRRRVRLDQELLADAAATGPDRTAYAEALLGWARSDAEAPHSRYAGVLALAERPSELHRRIAALLDPSWHVEARCPRIWRMSAWGLVLLTALGLSLCTIRAADGRPLPVSQGSKTEAETADAIVFRGRVVDPDGRPFAGARLYLGYHAWRDPASPQPVRATSDPDGRFRFVVARGEFDEHHIEPWRIAHVVALAEGYAAGRSDSPSNEGEAGRELTVRLARDDVPVTGRLLDLEGRPVVGATIRVMSIVAPPGGDLTPWVKSAEARHGNQYELEARYLERLRSPSDDRLPEIPAVTSASDGRFSIRGIGRERVAELRIEAPTIRTLKAAVMTRAGEPVRVPIFGNRKNDWTKTYHPAVFELAAPPSRPVEGIVRDRDMGAPIAGATIRSYRLADLELGNNQLIRIKTDSAGRFRMTGLPLGKGNEVVIVPPDDQPYLPSRRTLDELSAARPLRVDFVLKRGVWVEGRVTDKVTGRPARAYIRYAAAKDNPQVAEAPGFSQIENNGDYSDICETGRDGTYRIAALPGRGVLAAQVDGMIYQAFDELSRTIPDRGNYVPHIYQGELFAQVDIREGRGAPRCDLALVPARTVEGIVLDPRGTPIAGARVNGDGPLASWGWRLESERFTVSGLAPPRTRSIAEMFKARNLDAMASMILPERPRVVLFQHETERLAGWAEVTTRTVGPVEVRLQPWATASGRMVDRYGDPRRSFAIQPQVIDEGRLGDGAIAHRPYRTYTDGDGHFHLEGLVPGLRYRLALEDVRGVNTWRGPELPPLEPGEGRNLGDVVAIVPGESD